MVDLSFDFSAFKPVNDLWPACVERLGLDRSKRAVQQALDLQGMSGGPATLPVLFADTCGVALASTVLLREQTGLNAHAEGMVLLLSKASGEIQLIWGR